MNAFFAELGRTVLERWKDSNFSLPHFSKIACDVLAERPPGESVDVAAFIREFLLNDAQPVQSSSGFGQPELIVYDDPRFYIQLLFWLDGTTQIHQHEFSGAFHVLAGSSLHSEFTFENARSITANFRVGDLRLKKSEYLPAGTTRSIVSGREHIHALFHLETPSLSLVIRTHSDPGTGPQFTYLPPHIAVDPFHTDAFTTRRTQVLDMLEALGDGSYAELVLEMVAELDFERGFFIIQNCLSHLKELGAWKKVWAAFRKKHGALARYAAPTLEEIVWRDRLSNMRSSVIDHEHRFFLACLMNVPARSGLLDLVAKSFPGKPATETILRWLQELCESSDISVWILDAELPPELGIPTDRQQPAFLAAFRHFLKPGKTSAGKSGLTARELSAIRNAIAGSSLRALIA